MWREETERMNDEKDNKQHQKTHTHDDGRSTDYENVAKYVYNVRQFLWKWMGIYFRCHHSPIFVRSNIFVFLICFSFLLFEIHVYEPSVGFMAKRKANMHAVCCVVDGYVLTRVKTGVHRMMSRYEYTLNVLENKYTSEIEYHE